MINDLGDAVAILLVIAICFGAQFWMLLDIATWPRAAFQDIGASRRIWSLGGFVGTLVAPIGWVVVLEYAFFVRPGVCFAAFSGPPSTVIRGPRRREAIWPRGSVKRRRMRVAAAIREQADGHLGLGAEAWWNGSGWVSAWDSRRRFHWTGRRWEPARAPTYFGVTSRTFTFHLAWIVAAVIPCFLYSSHYSSNVAPFLPPSTNSVIEMCAYVLALSIVAGAVVEWTDPRWPTVWRSFLVGVASFGCGAFLITNIGPPDNPGEHAAGLGAALLCIPGAIATAICMTFGVLIARMVRRVTRHHLS
jgi:hypothetical protein